MDPACENPDVRCSAVIQGRVSPRVNLWHWNPGNAGFSESRAEPASFPGSEASRKGSGNPLMVPTTNRSYYFACACSSATATATLAPTMGLLPMPRNPIISTCAGTEDDPANWASLCMRPMVSVMP